MEGQSRFPSSMIDYGSRGEGPREEGDGRVGMSIKGGSSDGSGEGPF